MFTVLMILATVLLLFGAFVGVIYTYNWWQEALVRQAVARVEADPQFQEKKSQ